MGKISQLFFLCVIVTTFWVSVHSDEGNNLDAIDDMLPPEVITFLKTYTGDAYGPTTTESPVIVVPKIADGNDAGAGNVPHQVSLYSYSGGHFCGGSIIHPFLILSAAHCFGRDAHRPPNIIVRAGFNRRQWMDHNSTEQIRNVTHVFVHKAYSSTTFNNDIAVLVLNQSLDFNEYVRPIRLGSPGWELPEHADVTGWGRVWARTARGLRDMGPAYTLQVARVPLVSRENCTKRLSALKYAITESMICAGGNGSDACEGGAGGPLTCVRNGTFGEEEPYLCDIVSWGVTCAT